MKCHNFLLPATAMLAVALLTPTVAKADFVLDTGTPTGSGAYLLNNSQLIAGEFAATAGDTITTVSAYLTGANDPVGTTFNFEIFSTANFSRSPTQVAFAQGVYTQDGWTTSTLNWMPTTSGDYWIALNVPSSRAHPGLDAPQEGAVTTGTVQALGFASASSANAGFVQQPSTFAGIGLQVSEATPAPLPAAAWLLGSGLVGLAVTARRKRPAAPTM